MMKIYSVLLLLCVMCVEVQGGRIIRGPSMRMRGRVIYDPAVVVDSEVKELAERSFQQYIIRMALSQLVEKKRVEKRVEKCVEKKRRQKENRLKVYGKYQQMLRNREEKVSVWEVRNKKLHVYQRKFQLACR